MAPIFLPFIRRYAQPQLHPKGCRGRTIQKSCAQIMTVAVKDTQPRTPTTQ